jgi:hypothetical protein
MAHHTDKTMELLLTDLMEKAEFQGYLLTDEILEVIPTGRSWPIGWKKSCGTFKKPASMCMRPKLHRTIK